MISTRYAIPVIILLASALIPTTIHSYIGAKFNDGKSVHNIAVSLDNFNSSPTKRKAQWGIDVFGTEEWFEREYRNDQPGNVRLFTVRSYDHKRVYHHPELTLSHAQSLEKKGIHYLPGNTEIPARVFYGSQNSTLVAYVLLYNDVFVANPIKHQLSDAFRSLVKPNQQMTLFYASQSGVSSNIPFENTKVAEVLSLAIQDFQNAGNKQHQVTTD